MNADYVNHAARGYVVTALWSSTGDDGEPLDATYEVLDLAPATLADMLADVEAFVTANESDLTDLDAEQVGHDFWLTRNRHGAGFWDRGLGERGDRLTEAAHVYGGTDLYVGDDGRIYA